jgi:hypothetical protein
MGEVYSYVLLYLILSVQVAKAQDLNFKTTTPVYSGSALSNNYTGIGNPSVDVSVNVSSNGVQTFTLGTPKPVTNGLEIGANFSNLSDSKIITIEFSQGVSNLSFSIYGVDGNANSQDQVTIIADKYGTSVSPVITPSAYASVSGNTLLGIADETSSSHASLVQFGDFVKKLTIIYTSGPSAPPNPTAQGITIGNLNWTAPLPIILLSFTAKSEGDRVQLAWATASERDADRFIVERSNDQQEYISICEVAANGNTLDRQEYGLTDFSPQLGVNYYRLKQISSNGTVQTFNARVSAVIESGESAASVYPNPAGPDRIHFRLLNVDNVTVKLLTPAGQLINGKLEQQSGEADWIPDQPLLPGLHLLQINAGDLKRTVKVLVH